jgi:tellurite methyltransferase
MPQTYKCRGVAAPTGRRYVRCVSEQDRERWNRRYRDGEEVREVSPFLSALDPVLPRRGRALDVAGGAGRHAIWLGRRGLAATLTDVSDVALSTAARDAQVAGVPLETLRIDLEAAPLPAGLWDVILIFSFLHRPLFAALPPSLAPGGWLVVAHPTRTNLSRHPRPGAEHLLDDGELPTLIRGLDIVSCEERWFESGHHEARLVARRPA